ncbi:hypothetical protein JX265_004715 [Neoarthrinium moseri]|uniref:Uncharacterized protein n=1 Tax=Neoarthrinium moseri TaxID=1658444 RepID=A0A9Q0ANA9_9PEZI|nr:hypothetical protein JX265_004715 [Neoarthrinium moseri]
MAAELKAEVRQSARERRARSFPKAARPTSSSHVAPAVPHTASSTVLGSSTSADHSRSLSSPLETESHHLRISYHRGDDVRTGTIGGASARLSKGSPTDNSFGTRDLSQDYDELDLVAVMRYMDTIFPQMFPYYCPPTYNGGRDWLLVQVLQSPTLLNITSCISLLFYSDMTQEQEERISNESMLRNATTRHELGRRVEKAIASLQSDILALSSPSDILPSPQPSIKTQDKLYSDARLLGSILQLLCFEVGSGNSANSLSHLDAALTLFVRILHDYGTKVGNKEADRPTFALVLERMARPSRQLSLIDGVSPMNTDQAAFRFYSTVLLINDILISSSLSRAPRLQDYHLDLLGMRNSSSRKSGASEQPGSPQTCTLDVEIIIGCQGWVLFWIGEALSLDFWKKDQVKQAQLDAMDLVDRANVIKNALEEGIRSLAVTSTSPPNIMDLDETGEQDRVLDQTIRLTKTWADAALIFLSMAVSGWQPYALATSSAVERVLDSVEHLAAAKNVAVVNRLVWPLCVAGCLAKPDQHPRIRAIIAGLGPKGLFSTLSQAIEIMERAWAGPSSEADRREGIAEGRDLDLALCLNSLGYPVLLV